MVFRQNRHRNGPGYHQPAMASLKATITALLWEAESTTLDFKQAQYPFAGVLKLYKRN